MTSWRVFSSPDEAKDSKPRNRLGSSRSLSGSADGVTPAGLSGAFGSQPQPAVHNGLPGIDARTVGAVVIRLEPFASQQLRVRDKEIQPSRPLSWCSTQRTLYWSLSSPGIRTRSKLAISFSRWPGGKSCSERQHAGGVFFA
ncbi:hypothetical protein [Pantoea stewartii]|uniref:hypothetical protein n=1 Tax=Pantoea stewartii TaxID=66269 RepID=UPI003DA70E98